MHPLYDLYVSAEHDSERESPPTEDQVTIIYHLIQPLGSWRFQK